MEVDADELLTIKEVSKLTKLQIGSLYHLVSQKRIRVVRLSSRCIRFRRQDLRDWVVEHCGELSNSEDRKGKA